MSTDERASTRNQGYRRWSLQEIEDWVAPQVPSPVILRLVAGEFEHFKKFNTGYGRWVVQTEVHFTRLVTGVEQVDYQNKSNWPVHRGTQFILVTNTLRTLWSAADRLHRGAYQDSLTLVRLAYEVWARSVFLSCYPSEFLPGVAPSVPKGSHDFNMTNFLREELRLDWLKSYELLSMFAHGKLDTFVAVLDHAQNQVPRRHQLSVSFDESRCDFAITHLNFVLLLFLTFVKDQLLIGAPESLSSLLNESNEILRTCLFENPEPYWANTEADLNYVAALLTTADAGGDWKSLVKARPQVIRSASNA